MLNRGKRAYDDEQDNESYRKRRDNERERLRGKQQAKRKEERKLAQGRRRRQEERERHRRMEEFGEMVRIMGGTMRMPAVGTTANFRTTDWIQARRTGNPGHGPLAPQADKASSDSARAGPSQAPVENSTHSDSASEFHDVDEVLDAGAKVCDSCRKYNDLCVVPLGKRACENCKLKKVRCSLTGLPPRRKRRDVVGKDLRDEMPPRKKHVLKRVCHRAPSTSAESRKSSSGDSSATGDDEVSGPLNEVQESIRTLSRRVDLLEEARRLDRVRFRDLYEACRAMTGGKKEKDSPKISKLNDDSD
ncbi:hypothetical protein C8R47DRAFT_642398 [Mycena vitilis]|nr:hypothetical protein C8R47DRAFT_642398 [Mycena vitilis]